LLKFFQPGRKKLDFFPICSKISKEKLFPMNKKVKKIILILIIAGLSVFGTIRLLDYWQNQQTLQAEAKLEQEIKEIITTRQLESENNQDPFGHDDKVKVLFLGIDSRAGQSFGHCDAIQMIEINRAKEKISITAVPRGTYCPLPEPGHQPSEYYLAKSCEIGGIDYGIEQIEQILNKQADYVVMVGFSEALGIFRDLGLPATETLQWLRNRQGFAIGEPQRAHNHSTFIKQMLTKYTRKDNTALNGAWDYLIYKMVNTDLSFTQARKIKQALIDMNLAENKNKITLDIKPYYSVQDIAFDEHNLDDQLKKLLYQHPENLSDSYSGKTKEQIEQDIIGMYEQQKENQEFTKWAFENSLWLQVENKQKRLQMHYKLLKNYVWLMTNKQERKALISDYILEMKTRNLPEWEEKGKQLFQKTI